MPPSTSVANHSIISSDIPTTLEFPIIYLLSTHLDPDSLSEWESKIPTLTYDINEASIVLGKISNPERARFELRRRKIITEDIDTLSVSVPNLDTQSQHPSPPLKRKRSNNLHNPAPTSTSGGDKGLYGGTDAQTINHSGQKLDSAAEHGDSDKSVVNVLKLAWFGDSLAHRSVLPIDKYLLYRGRKTEQIIQRARQEGKDGHDQNSIPKRNAPRAHESMSQHSRISTHTKRPTLTQESTSEHDLRSHMPPIPEYLHTTYSCQRPTPCSPPNDLFIEELKKIRALRTLEGDAIGVRAYSTSIASLAAYPFLILHPAEIARLPGCSDKIAALYRQWKANSYLEEVKAAEADPKISVLQLFCSIWGVAETTAGEFYNKGWRDLDDVVEGGWTSLSPVQQIGLKYYDELQEKIARREVEEISQTILSHAQRICPGFQMVIVGSYRRGKIESGDVDVVLSHPDPTATLNFVESIVESLEKANHITHTLILSTKNSERGQTPVAWKGQDRKAGSGFDTLDKALVVWQNPHWDKTASPKNPNPHRRVDIIVSPWKTAGCAVIGWTGGTTFERDLRRYCKREKGWKFDSSGVRSRIDGSWVDIESDDHGPAPDMLTAEKRAFARLGLEWRPPEERCTG